MAPVRDDRFSVLTASISWLMIVLMILPGGLDYARRADAGDVGNPVTRALWLAILASSIVIMLARVGLTVRLLRGVNVFFIIFIGLAVASIAWSVDPALTLRRIVRLLTLCGAVFAMAVAAWHRRRFQQLVRPVVTLMLLGSIVFGLMQPDLAIHQETSAELMNAWHGLATQKNELGALASFGCILWLHGTLAKEAKPLGALIGGTVAATCLLLSRSSTSLMATVFASLFLLVLMRTPGSMRRSTPYLVTGLAAMILIYSIAILRLVPGLEILLTPIPMITGKDMTFSGRADIWAAVADHIRLHPILGSGYGAYWAGPVPGSDSFILIQVLRGFYPGSAHNGYLDVWNDLGIVGLMCLGGYLIVYLRQSLRLLVIDRSQGALFLALFLQQAITNLSETHWLAVTSLDFVLMSFATTSLARALLDARHGPPVKVPPPGPRFLQHSVARRPFRVRRPV